MYPNGYEGGYGQYVLHKRSRNKKKLSDLGLDNMVEKAKKVNAKQKQVNKKGGKRKYWPDSGTSSSEESSDDDTSKKEKAKGKQDNKKQKKQLKLASSSERDSSSTDEVSSDDETETDDTLDDDQVELIEVVDDHMEDIDGVETYKVEKYSNHDPKTGRVQVVWGDGSRLWQYIADMKKDLGEESHEEYLRDYKQEEKEKKQKREQDKIANTPCLTCGLKVPDGNKCSDIKCGLPSHKKCGMAVGTDGAHVCYACLDDENQLIMTHDYLCENDHGNGTVYQLLTDYWTAVGRRCQGDGCTKVWLQNGKESCNDMNPAMICKGSAQLCKMIYCIGCFEKIFGGGSRKRTRRSNV